jgi:multicomponent Na+:H+ antiporter subunit B
MRKSRIVGHIAAVFYPFCLVFGLYVVLHGHLTPGGGFQGGAVMATGAALMMVAGMFDEGEREIKYHHYKAIEAFGLLLFIGLAFAGILSGHGAFFRNIWANAGGWFGAPGESGSFNSGGLLPLMNLAVGVEVFGGISVILVTMIRAMKAAERGEDREDGDEEGEGAE